MKLAPLDSAHIGLSIHAKNSSFCEKINCKILLMIYFSIAGHYYDYNIVPLSVQFVVRDMTYGKIDHLQFLIKTEFLA